MTGKAYTPGGFEPGVTGRFAGPPPEVIKAHRGLAIQHPQRTVPYDEAMEYRKRGEAHVLGHYVYEMMYDIYAGIEDELLEGAWDTHLHIFPDYVPRGIDVIELAIKASKVKMGGILFKDHFFSNVGAAWAAQWVIDEMVRKGELDYACKVLGTNIFAWSHHPDQVNLIRKYPNLGAIFFRTMTGGGVFAGSPLPVIDDNGKILPDVKDCIKRCADYKIPIMTGHVGLFENPEELMALVTTAHEFGTHILVTHAQRTSDQNVEERVAQCKEWSKLGAFLEINFTTMIPNMMHPCVDPNEVCDVIRGAGPENCCLNTDWGQPLVYDPIDGYRIGIRALLHYGFSEQEIRTMVNTNHVKYLYLDEKS